MSFAVRALENDDFDNAADLIWHTFYYRESKGYSMEGIEKFRDITSAMSLKINSADGSVLFFGAFDGEELVGVGSIKNHEHINLLFADNNRLGEGIGSALLAKLVSLTEGGRLSVNSSDFGREFYKKHGFIETGERQVSEGIIFSPMSLETKNYLC